jgi:uncharacterized protein YndB with AHSA1/START domain
MATSKDRIEKEVTLKAPRDRVWRALADAKEFGAWFGVELENAFAPGATVRGRLTISGYQGLPMEMVIVEMVAERRFSYRWHPYALDPKADYSKEPTTLVTFELEDVAGGTRLRVVESGFDEIPLARRAKAWEMNEGGWAAQMKRIERHVTQAL